MDKITELKNIVHQKFLKIAKRARIKDEDGKSTKHEFCCLMRLQALLIALTDNPNPKVCELQQMEILANSICGRDRFLYKPVDWCALDFDAVEEETTPPLSACDIVYENPNLEADHETLCSYVDKIIDTLNYEEPWIKFEIISGLPAGKYEVGSGGAITDVKVTVNKSALNFYDIDKNGTLVQYARELQNAIPNQLLNIDLKTAAPTSFLLHGEYFDLQKHLNKHLKAETELKWETVWPYYYGVGPLNSLDNNPNAFIQSLNKGLDGKTCFELDIPEGMVLYFFYPYEGVKKEFVSENGVMRGSYKGELEGVRTKSMDDYSIAGGKTYGVIRTDQEGIRFLKFCVEDMLIEEMIQLPVIPQVVTQEPVITYSGAWSDVSCVKIDE